MLLVGYLFVFIPVLLPQIKQNRAKPCLYKGLKIKMLVSSQTGIISISMYFFAEAFSQQPSSSTALVEIQWGDYLSFGRIKGIEE